MKSEPACLPDSQKLISLFRKLRHFILRTLYVTTALKNNNKSTQPIVFHNVLLLTNVYHSGCEDYTRAIYPTGELASLGSTNAQALTIGFLNVPLKDDEQFLITYVIIQITA